MIRLILLCLLLTSCGHFDISIVAHGTGSRNGTKVLSYNTMTDEFVLLDTKKYKKQLIEFKEQFFPDKLIKPKIADSMAFNFEEFKRMCGFVSIPQCLRIK